MTNKTDKYVVLDANDPNQIILRRADLHTDETLETKDTFNVTFHDKDGVRSLVRVEHDGVKKGKTIKDMQTAQKKEDTSEQRLGVAPVEPPPTNKNKA